MALLRGETVVAERTEPEQRIHSPRILPAIEALLSEAGAHFDDIETYAVSTGPGSFTGLRIGIATVKGWALVDGRQVVGVPTLQALASTAGEVTTAALLDARRGEAYAGVWNRPSDPGEPIVGEGVFRPEELARVLPEACALVVGEDAAPLADALVALRPDVVRQPESSGVARAGRVGVLAARMRAVGGFGDAADLVPRYVRRAEAEARRLGSPTETR